jgi:hypothetical protein
MGGHDDGALRPEKTAAWIQQRLEHGPGIIGVEMFGGLVEQDDRSLREERTGKEQPSPLTSRNRLGATGQYGGQTLGQCVEPPPQPNPLDHIHHFVVAAVAAHHEQVVTHRGGEQVRILGEKDDVLDEFALLDRLEGAPVEIHIAAH